MRKFYSLLSAYFLPITGTVATAWQLSQTIGLCIICLIMAACLLALYIYLKKQRSKYAIVSLISCIIMACSSAIGIIVICNQQKRSNLWNQYLEAKKAGEVDELKIRADSNDGPAQYDLSTRYFYDGDYSDAKEYAQKAADNGCAMGYSLLASLYQNGLGCPVNIRQAVSNMIKAMRLDCIKLSSIEDIHDLSETERLALADCEKDAANLISLRKEIVAAFVEKGELGVLNSIGKHHDELLSLSNKGFIPASELLYTEEAIKHPEGTDELQRLATILYQVNHIPTGPWNRFVFFKSMKRINTYNSDDYPSFIKDNIYLYLLPDIGNPILKGNPAEEYSNQLLISQYQLFRAQYTWCRELDIDSDNRIDYQYGVINNYHSDYLNAKMFLKRQIRAIQSRMNNLDWPYETERELTTNLDISVGDQKDTDQ